MSLMYVESRQGQVRSTRGGAAGVLIVFTLLLSIAAKAGLFGIPLAFIVISGFFKYAYILFDPTVSGYDEPPATSRC